MFKSLRLQLLFFFLITNIVVLSGFSLFIYSTAQKGIVDTLDGQLKIVSFDAIGDVKGKEYVDAKLIANELMQEFEIDPLYIKVVYYGKESKKVEHTALSSEEHRPLFKIPLNEMGHLHSIYYFDKEFYRVSSMLLFEDDEMKVFFQLAVKKTVHSPYLDRLAISLLIANPIILILFLLIANVLINKTLFSVKKVIESVHTLSPKQLSQRINSDDAPTEIEELIQTFNKLLDSIEEAFNRISAFSSDASHELKTPLTVIRGEIEVGLRQERTPAEYKAILEDVVQETIQIQETIDQLFFLTKKDSTELTNNFEELYLDEIIINVVSQLEKFASTKSVQVKVIEIVPITVHVNEFLLKVALSNLLRNAIVYSKEDNEVRIFVRNEKTHYVLQIEDDGRGISKEDLPFIFDRFYRADKARSRQKGGTGLGLSIVKMILDIHQYDISLESVLDKGTKVTVIIPK